MTALRKPVTAEILKWDGDQQTVWVEQFCEQTERHMNRIVIGD